MCAAARRFCGFPYKQLLSLPSFRAPASSGSGLDPEISPAAAEFQIPRVARARHLKEAELGSLVAKHTLGRQFGSLGEPRVNVLELNLDLDAQHPLSK
jgi:potassium-transporting ATPase KdpC subunit